MLSTPALDVEQRLLYRRPKVLSSPGDTEPNDSRLSTKKELESLRQELESSEKACLDSMHRQVETTLGEFDSLWKDHSEKHLIVRVLYAVENRSELRERFSNSIRMLFKTNRSREDSADVILDLMLELVSENVSGSFNYIAGSVDGMAGVFDSIIEKAADLAAANGDPSLKQDLRDLTDEVKKDFLD